MGLKQTQTQGQNNLLFTTIVGLKKGDTEKIGFSVKKGEEMINGNELSGEITKIELGTYEYEGKKRDTFKLYLKDINETYVLSSAFTALAKNLLNSLASAETYGIVTMQLYVNKAGYNSVSVKNNGEQLSRKYDIRELNSMITTTEMKDGTKVNDFFDQIEFLKNTVISQIKQNIEKTKENAEKF